MKRRPVNRERPAPLPPPEAGSHRGLKRDPAGTAPGTAPVPPDWGRQPIIYSAYPRAFGPDGTLAGITGRVGEIAALGADILWLLPIHPVGMAGRKGSLGSPYAIRDYRAVNPEYGTEAELRALVAAAHGAGLKLILDCVYNHGAPDHVMAAAHPDWFARDRRGRPTRRVADWSDVVDWDFRAPGLAGHLLDALARWVGEFGVDGFRCDVAGMVPASFWRRATERLAALRPDTFLLAEWDDPAIHRAGFHASYDWELYRAMRRVVRGATQASVLARLIERRTTGFPAGAQAMRFVENHDEYRACHRLGPSARALGVFTALAGGAFLVYNGQEVGARHRPSLFEREPIDWSPPGAAAERAWWRALLAERRRLAEFGAAVAIDTGHAALAAYRRAAPEDRSLVVAFNGGARPIDWTAAAGARGRVIEPGSTTWPESETVVSRIPARSTAIFTNV
jgi:glycosidase